MDLETGKEEKVKEAQARCFQLLCAAEEIDFPEAKLPRMLMYVKSLKLYPNGVKTAMKQVQTLKELENVHLMYPKLP